MNTNRTTYRNMMVLPLPLTIHPHSHQSPVSNGFYQTSYYPTSTHHRYFDEQIVRNPAFVSQPSRVKRRSVGPSSAVLFYKMQANTTTDSTIGVPSPSCSVCGDISTGIHFGGNSCESCKAFFRRSVQCLRFQNYKCSGEERCPVNIVTRKVCQFCRYSKCTAIGMKSKWVLSDQEREEKYGARRKRFRENRVADEDPDIYKYLNKEEKLLIEDIAHALYQSRATYPLSFPNPSILHGTPPNPPAENANVQSPTSEKPPSAPANLLIVPIQRLVLFARMLKDFDLFTEDDKVSLLKGSAIEIMVCSSNTLFNPKTHTFTNYLSRDQRAIVDDQVLSLDPLFMKMWGEEVFNRTRNFLISMCNLHIDEVTSTLLVPVILFSPDRLNVKDLNLVKRLQEKYATILRKYMHWRYGNERTDLVYPKLLLQTVNLRALGFAHGEIIQKFMASSSVNPLVQEVLIRPEMLNRPTTDSLSSSSSPPDIEMMEFDKTPSNDTESTIGSDEDDFPKKKPRSSIDDDLDFDTDDLDGSDPRNIWRKRRKLSDQHQMSSTIQTEITNIAEKPSNQNQTRTTNDYKNVDKYPTSNCLHLRPHDHQVPAIVPVHHDDFMVMSNSGYSIPNQFRQLPVKRQSFVTTPQSIQQLQQLYRAHSSSTSDLSSYDYHPNPISNSTMLPTSGQYYDDQTYENYRQHYAHVARDSSQQQQNEQQLLQLSLANNQTSPSQSLNNHPTGHQSQSLGTNSRLDDEEQQLLNAIHSHPNKRDLVLNLLRQMDQSNSSVRDQHRRSDPSAHYKP